MLKCSAVTYFAGFEGTLEEAAETGERKLAGEGMW